MKAVLPYLLGLVVATLFVVAPPWLSAYGQSVLVVFTINVILVCGYRLITMTGNWSFAHVAFMGIGGYVLAIATTAASAWSFWIALLAAPLAGGLAALILTYPVLRTRQHYFFLITFAAGEAINQCFIKLVGITGGTSGIAFIPRPSSIGGLDFSLASHYEILVVLVAVVACGAIFALDRSSFGNTTTAVAENENLSESLGIDTFRYRAACFIGSGVVAGISGALLAGFNGILNPQDFGAGVMFKVVAAAIIGGSQTFYGPILGLICLTILEELSRNQAEFIPLLWGIAVVAVLLASPGGLEDLFRGRRAREVPFLRMFLGGDAR